MYGPEVIFDEYGMPIRIRDYENDQGELMLDIKSTKKTNSTAGSKTGIAMAAKKVGSYINSDVDSKFSDMNSTSIAAQAATGLKSTLGFGFFN